MKNVYWLLIILGMTLWMSSQFSRFTAHYEYLQSQLDYINSHCVGFK